MKRLKNGLEYEKWKLSAIWGMPNLYDYTHLKGMRKPLPDEIIAQRSKHMKKLRDEGAPYAWIARLYDMSRHHARCIILDIPNH